MWQSYLENWETPEWGSSGEKAKQKIINASSWMFTKDDKKCLSDCFSLWIRDNQTGLGVKINYMYKS